MGQAWIIRPKIWLFDRVLVPETGTASANRVKQQKGLGLPLAHELIVAHGGDMELRSEKGQGTSITIKLPRE